MATTILETFGTIRADGTLDLEQRLAGAPRRVKVRVEEMEDTESDADFAARFAQLVATWKEGTRHRSRMDQMAAHPAFREIVAMGASAVPLILAHLEKHPFLFLALQEITGDDPPIPAGYRGNKEICAGWTGYDIEGIQAAWLAWGRAKGYK